MSLQNSKLVYLVVGIIAVVIFFMLFTKVWATQPPKVFWCHTEPNGNQQTLELPLAALENAGHVDANGNPLHAGDHAGACIEPTPTIQPTATPTQEPECEYECEEITPTPTQEPEVTPTVTPTPEVTESPTASPTPTVEPYHPPSPHGDGLSDGRSDGRSSSPQPTLVPCGVDNCGNK